MIENGELFVEEQKYYPLLQIGQIYSGQDQWKCECGKWHSMNEECTHLKLKIN